MANLIPVVKELQDEMRRQWPKGTTDLYKRVPHLLRRIEELENALAPFARAAKENAKHQVPPDKLIQVYMRDTIHAYDMLDERQGVKPKVEDFGIPAE